jgi:uncharacterized membrane protein
MVDVFLVISAVVAFFVLLVIGVYLLVYYSHPDDKNEAYMPKLVVLGGFVLAASTTLLLPLDVANNAGYAGTSACRRLRSHGRNVHRGLKPKCQPMRMGILVPQYHGL